ncbi:hypothetical protein [Bradyrhizobium cytisi]|uniref:Uncharacterized protein n=1 Tax=Bradyrhizobium cytisi TaxID=515489 RepID=A0A5S4X3D2_9BRAD|nr:hypothetical protein [Bradyrhizobium cytisi]TYL87473.1 hypothetical protein FXB38_04990 [Bradyrhizobium cytisi]
MSEAAELEEALQRIVQWSKAYSLDIFPEPDLGRAAELLKLGHISLDAISVHCMRHAVLGVGEIARAALARAARIERVDQSLTRQLSRSMQLNAELRQRIR